MTFALAKRLAKVTAMQPLPVPKSYMTGQGIVSAILQARSTSCSVSGRGTSTAGVTWNSNPQKKAVPRMCCNGSRLARRAAWLLRCSSCGSGMVSSSRRGSSTLEQFSKEERSHSAFTSGDSTPEDRKRSVNSRLASETVIHESTHPRHQAIYNWLILPSPSGRGHQFCPC